MTTVISWNASGEVITIRQQIEVRRCIISQSWSDVNLTRDDPRHTHHLYQFRHLERKHTRATWSVHT